jgi:hypothetical protein
MYYLQCCCFPGLNPSYNILEQTITFQGVAVLLSSGELFFSGESDRRGWDWTLTWTWSRDWEKTLLSDAQE